MVYHGHYLRHFRFLRDFDAQVQHFSIADTPATSILSMKVAALPVLEK